jgi:alpha-L-rhamnosidase
MMAEMKPVKLMCEHLTNPVGIDVPSPRLSWALESPGRGKKQSAYQILVSHTEQEFREDNGTLWDSGKVLSDETVGVVYAGEEVPSGARCFWKVRVWDENDIPSPYSEGAAWQMGLLRRSDWSASWIGLGEGAVGGIEPPSGEKYDDVRMGLLPSPYLRKTFELGGAVRRATLYATARGVYEMRLNGSRVGEAVLAPGWTDYNKRIQYQTYDVTGMLAEGQNVLGGILGDGWYAGFVGMDPKRRGAHYGPYPQLLAQLVVELDDGTTARVVTDRSWTSSTGPIVFSDLLMGETYDAREERRGWDRADFDDSGWHPASTQELDDALLVAEPSLPIEVMQEVEAVSVTEPSRGVYVFDLGQNMVGWVRLEVAGEAGTEVTLRHAEVLNQDGTIYTENLRSARQADTYILRGGEQEAFEPHFTFHGFRYVEVTGYPEEPPLNAVTGRVIHSATPPAGEFECSDPMVNKLQSNIVWGQRGNFVSIPTDCPQRDERLGWLGDAQVFVRTASFNMDVSAFFTKWMVDVEDAQSAQGAFPDVAPVLPDLSLINLSEGAPAWGDAGIVVPWTIYRVYGDTRIVERHYDAMTRWMEYVRRANPDLLRTNRLNNNYGDWLSPEGDDTPKDLLATAYFAYDAKLMAEMARAIGRQDDANRYEELFRGIKDAFVEAYVGADGRIKGDTQTGYVLALHMDLLPEDLREVAARHLVRAVEREDWHLSTGFAGVGYLLPVLTEFGYVDVAYRLLTNKTYPSWGYTIEHGATTIWERWDGWTDDRGFQSPNMNSFNHYSLGSVGEWLYRYVAGIDLDPREPGYKRVVINPRLGGDLTSARGTCDSIRGKIVSDWELADGELRLKIGIPANTTATVYLPAAAGGRVMESGELAERAEGIESLTMEGETAILTVGSGEYEFVTRVG